MEHVSAAQLEAMGDIIKAEDPMKVLFGDIRNRGGCERIRTSRVVLDCPTVLSTSKQLKRIELEDNIEVDVIGRHGEWWCVVWASFGLVWVRLEDAEIVDDFPRVANPFSRLQLRNLRRAKMTAVTDFVRLVGHRLKHLTLEIDDRVPCVELDRLIQSCPALHVLEVCARHRIILTHILKQVGNGSYTLGELFLHNEDSPILATDRHLGTLLESLKRPRTIQLRTLGASVSAINLDLVDTVGAILDGNLQIQSLSLSVKCPEHRTAQILVESLRARMARSTQSTRLSLSSRCKFAFPSVLKAAGLQVDDFIVAHIFELAVTTVARHLTVGYL